MRKPSIAQRRLFRQLAALEPLLASLFIEASEVRDPGGESFCANDVWYRRFKPRMRVLAGWERPLGLGSEVLRSAQAYDAVYDVLYHAIPVDCRNCGCVDLRAILSVH